MAEAPEQKARCEIDAKLVAAGWIVQDRELGLTAGRGIADDVLCDLRARVRKVSRRHPAHVCIAPAGRGARISEEIVVIEREEGGLLDGLVKVGASRHRRTAALDYRDPVA